MMLCVFVLVWLCLFAKDAFGAGFPQPPPGSGCTFDPNCFYYAPGCTLTGCPPFNRSTPVTCDQCIQMCLEKQVGEYPYFCRGIVYDCYTKTCDMFGVEGGKLAKDQNKFYFKPTGACRGTPGIPMSYPCNVSNQCRFSAPITSCSTGQVPRIVAAQDSQFNGIQGQAVPNVDAHGCAEACLKNELPGGGAAECKTAQFRHGECTLSTSVASAENQIQPDSGSSVLQKFCFDAGSVTDCPDVFDEFPQKVLIGQNRQTLDSTSLQDCIQNCLNAKSKFGFKCSSVDFYYNVKTQNCILNDETRTTKPDLFTDIKDDKVTYVEMICGGGPEPSPTTGPVETISPTVETTTIEATTRIIGGDVDTLPPLPSLGTLPPLRFLADFKKQTFEKSLRDFSSTAVCKALVYNGLKKCPIGVISQGGRMRYCVRPVDC